MVEFTIGDIINVNSNVDAGEGETISVYKWKWNNTEFGENISDINIDTSDMPAGNYNLSLEVQNSCDNWSIPYSAVITLVVEEEPPINGEEPEEEPDEDDMSKIYGLLAGIGLGAILLFKK